VTGGPLVAILADDLLWATRLDRLVRDAGARAVLLRDLDSLDRRLADVACRPAGLVVDLTSRGYDGLAAIRRAAEAGTAVVAVGQHDDRAGRQAARAAGAADVYAYGRLFASGPQVLGGWVERLAAQRAGDDRARSA
jgi:CheY-like chemotaxis protein